MEIRDLSDPVRARLARLQSDDIVSRIRDRDRTVWQADPAASEVADRLGWLDSPLWCKDRLDELGSLSGMTEGSPTVLLLGMGGSSLAPAVLGSVLPGSASATLEVLDTTCPAAVNAALRRFNEKRALVVVSSKSGTTVETTSLFQTFFDACGEEGRYFVAITDPGTALEQLASRRNFRALFRNPPDIGGRFSALSYFGLVPAALQGLDPAPVVAGAITMRELCLDPTSTGGNPGVILGAVMGEAQLAGRDKLMVVVPPELQPLGLWVEQLVAESTGKSGRGIIPVIELEDSVRLETAPDRLWVLMAAGGTSGDRHPLASLLRERGAPFVEIRLGDPPDIGAEFFRWEFATAVAGHILGVNPFNQPDVEDSKRLARHRLSGKVPEQPDYSTVSGIRTVLDETRAGDYIALLCFCLPDPGTGRKLSRLKATLEERFRVPVVVEYGPRYLHSSGQLYKGGKNNGVFIVVLDDSPDDCEIPGADYGFRMLFRAQALGDFEALRTRGRRVVLLRGIQDLEDAIG